MMINTEGDFLRDKSAPRSEVAFKAVYFGAIAGAVGGLAEIAAVAVYSAGIGSHPSIVARGVTAAAGLGLLMPASPVAMGIFVHMTIAVVLGVTLSFAWKVVRPHFSTGAMLFPYMLAALTGVWAVNFYLLLPAVSPAFIHLMPYPVSLASKLLFGVVAAAVLRWSGSEMSSGRGCRSIGAPKQILASTTV